MDLGQQIVILLSIILVVWYVLFSFLNRRRGIATYHWLREGLGELGEISEAEWIGSSGSGARLVVSNAKNPFRRIEVVYLLQTREVPPLWIFNILRGKRDTLILKASLKGTPKQELEVARQGERGFETLLENEQKRPYVQVSAPEGYLMAYRGKEDDPFLERLRSFLNRYPDSVRQISLQRKTPHLIIQTNLPDLEEGPAKEFFAALSKTLVEEG
jgi:hypothetical protein